MNLIGTKAVRLRLDPASYGALRQQILRRDGWRCQSCGTMSNLEVHHKGFRSHAGEDSELNLIALCTSVTPAFMRLEKATTGSRCRPTTARLVQAGSSWGLKHSSVPT
jgi:hypothetical protein